MPMMGCGAIWMSQAGRTPPSRDTPQRIPRRAYKLTIRTSSRRTVEPEPAVEVVAANRGSADLLDLLLGALDDAKAEKVVTIDLEGKSSIADTMVVASGRSQRHVGAVADQLLRKLKDAGHGRARAEGLATCDWVLVDAGDVVVHIFRPEVREFYNLEKMWSADRPADIVPS
ncbi:MAG: ribosome silencing factor [Hyphomicrobiaceae bacterium]